MTPISGSFGGASRRGFGMTGKAKIPPLPPTSVTQLQPGATGTITTSLYIPEAGNAWLTLYLNGVPSNVASITGYAQPGTIQIAWGVTAGTQYTVQYKLTKNGLESPLSTAVTMWSGPPQTSWNSLTFSGDTAYMTWYADGFQRFKITRDGTVVYQPGTIEYGGNRSYSDTPPSNPGGYNTYAISNSIGASPSAGQGLWFSTPYAQSVQQPWKPLVTSVSASDLSLYVNWDFNTTNPPNFTIYADQWVSFDGGAYYNYYPINSVTVSGSARSAVLPNMTYQQGGGCPAYATVAVYANSASYPDPGYGAGSFSVYC